MITLKGLIIVYHQRSEYLDIVWLDHNLMQGSLVFIENTITSFSNKTWMFSWCIHQHKNLSDCTILGTFAKRMKAFTNMKTMKTQHTCEEYFSSVRSSCTRMLSVRSFQFISVLSRALRFCGIRWDWWWVYFSWLVRGLNNLRSLISCLMLTWFKTGQSEYLIFLIFIASYDFAPGENLILSDCGFEEI